MSSPDLLHLLQQRSTKCHLVGVAGSGMNGLARILIQKDHRVSGSDLKRTDSIGKRVSEGLTFFQGHDAANLPADCELLIYSSAVREENPERLEATRRGIPQVRRADALAAMCAGKRLILVAGAHGKSTSSAMIAHALRAFGKAPSFYIGAEVPILEASAHLDSGEFFVIESDESDGTIDLFSPEVALVLNVDAEHLDHFKCLEGVLNCFRDLGDRTSGHLVYCADDANSSALFANRRNVSSFGFAEEAQYRVTASDLRPGRSLFQVQLPKGESELFELCIPGRHNVSNAAGVIAVLDHLGLSPRESAAALKTFRGARRRFDVVYSGEDLTVVNDYAHHPTEIRATLSAARTVAKHRVVVAFQPHRYSRTQQLFHEFTTAFAGADALYMTEIYAASEDPIPGLSSKSICEAISARQDAYFCPTLQELRATVATALQPNDLLMVMGAGNVEEVAFSLGEALRTADALRAQVGGTTKIKVFEPMSKHTSIRIGGPADVWIEPGNEEDLSAVIRFCNEHGLARTMIGRGTNLLVKDAGIRGVCVHLGSEAFRGIRVENGKIIAGAGARLKQIVAEAKKAGIGGLEFMEGIPASLGGAMRMNAGAMGSWMFEAIESVRFMTPDGEVREIPASEVDVQYRNVALFREGVALGAVLKGIKKAPEEIAECLKKYSEKRWSSQPAAASAGCIFKNPKEIPAGKLIDELGLKNTRVGGACVSPVHGNFLVNEGNAKAREILQLMKTIQETALAKRGIRLEPEVIVLGEGF